MDNYLDAWDEFSANPCWESSNRLKSAWHNLSNEEREQVRQADDELSDEQRMVVEDLILVHDRMQIEQAYHKKSAYVEVRDG
jgi:hypothetical protein